jgi:hypothetical protein
MRPPLTTDLGWSQSRTTAGEVVCSSKLSRLYDFFNHVGTPGRHTVQDMFALRQSHPRTSRVISSRAMIRAAKLHSLTSARHKILVKVICYQSRQISTSSCVLAATARPLILASDCRELRTLRFLPKVLCTWSARPNCEVAPAVFSERKVERAANARILLERLRIPERHNCARQGQTNQQLVPNKTLPLPHNA